MDTSQQSGDDQDRNTSLSIRITIIVFWFLAITGFVLAVPILSYLENYLVDDYAYTSKSVHIEVQEMLHHKADLPPAEILEILSELRETLDIQAIDLKIGAGPVISSGISTPQLETDIILFDIPSNGTDHVSVQLLVYHPLLELEKADLRKNFLLSMGVFFIVFGAILAVVLRQIIAKPFLAMVKTAEDFSGGDQSARFNQTPTDEFGYLAKFFNRILDKLLQQKDELKSAFQNLKQSEITLSEEKERIEVTLDSIGDGVVTTNYKGIVEYLNPAAERLLDTTMLSVSGCHIDSIISLVDEVSLESINNPVLACLQTNMVVEQDNNSILTISGTTHRAVSYIVAPMRNQRGVVVGAVMVLRDVEQNRQLSRQLSYQASHDTLTDLYNRRAFEEHLKIALNTSIMNDSCHAMCYLDLDQFKIVNDTCGHVAGDALLQQLAEILRSRIRSSDVVARLGGDEFGILLLNCDPSHAEKVAADIVKLIGNFRFSWDDRLFETGVSIGLVVITPETQTVDQILSSADMACYVAKESGRSQVHIYEPDDAELNQRRGEMQWVSKIKEALETDRFQLYQQPIVGIGDTNSTEIHFEVLLRLLDESGNIVPPMTFIPAAERFQLMPSIDRWVITNTFEFLFKNIDRDVSYTCSINLSGQSLSDDKFMAFVEDAFSINNISPENICFEITETAAITHLNKAKRFIDKLSSMGCKFSLDDFGSGLSSFSYLKDLNVNYLKIDGTFIKDMVNNPVDFAMVKSINEIGHVMNLMTVAEFVENDAIIKQLKILGINYAQGYGIAKPSPISNILDKFTKKIPVQI